MEILFLGHAQLFVRTRGGWILIDPWFAEPVFGQSWWRYPPSPFPTPDTLPATPDLLLLSHIHPDHSGPRTLAMLDSETPTATMPFPSGLLERRLARAGFENTVSLGPFETRELLSDVRVTFVPHDRGWEVSSIVVEADGVRLYHGNDNTLSVDAYREVADRLGPIDVAFLPFAGASSYPTGFDWSRDVIEAKGKEKKAQGIKRLTDGIEGLQPELAVPFASSWALLEESELWKNYLDRPTAREAADAAESLGTPILVLDPGDTWTPDGVRRSDPTPWTYDRDSITRYATHMKSKVQAALAKRASHTPTDEQLDAAFKDYVGKMLDETRETTQDLAMVAGFASGNLQWHIRFTPGAPPALGDGPTPDADEVLTLEPAELFAILTTPWNWEDPWYGYRLRVHKRDGAGYYRAFWEMLLNYDDGIV